MQKVKQWSAAAVAVLAVSSVAGADTVWIGNAGGQLFPRDEFDLLAPIEIPGSGGATGIFYGGPNTPEFGIASLAAGVDDLGNPALLIGTGIGIPHVRVVNTTDMTQDLGLTTNFTGGNSEPVSAIAGRADGDVVIGVKINEDAQNPGVFLNSAMFMRDPTNLQQLAPGYLDPNDGVVLGSTGQGVTDIEVTSAGDVVVSNQAGELIVQSGTSLLTPLLGTLNNPSFIPSSAQGGIQINAIELTSTDTIIVGNKLGLVDSRALGDLDVSLGTADFAAEFGGAVAVTAMAMLPNDHVVIGFDNGSVTVRDATDLGTDLGPTQFATFTAGGLDITALDVTSNGNIVVGTENNLVFVQTAADLNVAAGIGTPGGTNFGFGITGFASFDIDLTGGGCGILLGDGTNDCLVTADDLISVQQNFGTVGPPNDGTLLGDTSDDGVVTADDLIEVQQNFGCTPTTSGCFFNGSTVLGPGGGGVPEPTTAGMLSAVALFLFTRRR